MKAWPVQEASEHFDDMLDQCLGEGPQIVSRSGEPKAVLISFEEWEKLSRGRPRTLKELLLTDEARTDDLVPLRQPWRMRPPPRFDLDD